MNERTEPVPPAVLEQRRAAVLERLGDGVLVLPNAPVRHRSRDTEYPFRPDSEFFWLTGLQDPGAVAVLVGGEDPGLEVFVRARDPEAELWSGPRPGPEAAAEASGARAGHDLDVLDSRLGELLVGPHRLYARPSGEGPVPGLVREALETGRARGPRKGTGPRELVDPGVLLDDLRLLKDAWEIRQMRRAAQVTVEGFRALVRALTEARSAGGDGEGAGAARVPEWVLEGRLEGAFRAGGGDGPAYESIVASGENACVLHYVANDAVARPGDLVLVDAGASVGWYAADITRTYPVSGRFSPDQRAVYEVVNRARALAVEGVAPGFTVSQVHNTAALALVEGLQELGVLRGSLDALMESEAWKPFFPHQTSHWLGLDVHDVGDYAVANPGSEGEGAGDRSARRMAPGMVLTVEPGLYFGPSALDAAAGSEAVDADRVRELAGLGIRLEDDVLVTDDGGENLTRSLPVDPDEVEAMIRG